MGGLALLAKPLPQRHLDSGCRPLGLPGDIRHGDGYSRLQAEDRQASIPALRPADGAQGTRARQICKIAGRP